MVKKTRARKRAEVKGKVVERALGPAADEFGREIVPLGKEAGKLTVKVGRLLISGLGGTVYGLEQVANWLRTAIAKRLEGINPGDVVEPTPRIAAPAVQTLIYSMGEKAVREMIANLLAADMDASRKHDTHPAFVEVIKQMTAADARILDKIAYGRLTPGEESEDKWTMATRTYPKNDRAEAMLSLSNLARLGLLELEKKSASMKDESAPMWVAVSYLTPFGISFIRTCMPSRGVYV